MAPRSAQLQCILAVDSAQAFDRERAAMKCFPFVAVSLCVASAAHVNWVSRNTTAAARARTLLCSRSTAIGPSTCRSGQRDGASAGRRTIWTIWKTRPMTRITTSSQMLDATFLVNTPDLSRRRLYRCANGREYSRREGWVDDGRSEPRHRSKVR